MSSRYNYPARIGGSGSARVTDNIVKGLAELGHDVFYHLKGKIAETPPLPIKLVDEMPRDIDIAIFQDVAMGSYFDSKGMPWLRTHHAPPNLYNMHSSILDHTIFVSKSHAINHGRKRFVYNGIDPEEFVYSETKENYFLFILSTLERAADKGIGIALKLVREKGIKIVLAGSAMFSNTLNKYLKICEEFNIDFVGEVSGQRKSELIAGASALLFPTQVAEPFGLVIVEALMSGTPVIASKNGACTEIITPDVGFSCGPFDDYKSAVDNLGDIKPAKCRERAMKHFHYIEMAKGYVKELEKEMSS